MTELLIVLSILSMIATFAIPKVLYAQNSARYNAVSKEAMATVASAYQLYVHQNGRKQSFSFKDLQPYLNYVRLKTSGTIDDVQTLGSLTCTASAPCAVFHNGGCLNLATHAFAGTTDLHFVGGTFDPDCTDSGTLTGLYKGVEFWIYYNGRTSTYASAQPGSVDSWGGVWSAPAPQYDPPWFSFN